MLGDLGGADSNANRRANFEGRVWCLPPLELATSKLVKGCASNANCMHSVVIRVILSVRIRLSLRIAYAVSDFQTARGAT